MGVSIHFFRTVAGWKRGKGARIEETFCRSLKRIRRFMGRFWRVVEGPLDGRVEQDARGRAVVSSIDPRHARRLLYSICILLAHSNFQIHRDLPTESKAPMEHPANARQLTSRSLLRHRAGQRLNWMKSLRHL